MTMINQTQQEITASYVLMDSWFTYAPLVQKNVERGLDVIGMVKLVNHAI
jgi:hypothetical protein